MPNLSPSLLHMSRSFFFLTKKVQLRDLSNISIILRLLALSSYNDGKFKNTALSKNILNYACPKSCLRSHCLLLVSWLAKAYHTLRKKLEGNWNKRHLINIHKTNIRLTWIFFCSTSCPQHTANQRPIVQSNRQQVMIGSHNSWSLCSW